MNFADIVKFGTYYNPASSHYAELSRVVCDRCHTNNLMVSIGYMDQDLCLPCANYIVNYVNNHINKNKITTKPLDIGSINSNPNRIPSHSDVLTKMMTHRFTDNPTNNNQDDKKMKNSERLTYMMTGRFANNTSENNSNNNADNLSQDSVENEVLTRMMTSRYAT